MKMWGHYLYMGPDQAEDADLNGKSVCTTPPPFKM